MKRYFTKPRAWVADDLDDFYQPTPSPVTVTDHNAVDTGLVDHRGDTIMRAPNPVGFVWPE
ncbi:hypothetical protein [Rhizorhapis suberifaciens]|uniref:Uncharacterized protein n=1 Tax=Rhizorhapis suberifaciens TaxID=13656 RepID=A0A840HWP8_9SPHN|nr:hypothetical protein [Rhizorhapis suberifaciens]MBB4642383.1 hypothetical protein [Rhizorhapis suberifaciens]